MPGSAARSVAPASAEQSVYHSGGSLAVVPDPLLLDPGLRGKGDPATFRAPPQRPVTGGLVSSSFSNTAL